jgi:hypothetical protein
MNYKKCQAPWSLDPWCLWWKLVLRCLSPHSQSCVLPLLAQNNLHLPWYKSFIFLPRFGWIWRSSLYFWLCTNDLSCKFPHLGNNILNWFPNLLAGPPEKNQPEKLDHRLSYSSVCSAWLDCEALDWILSTENKTKNPNELDHKSYHTKLLLTFLSWLSNCYSLDVPSETHVEPGTVVCIYNSSMRGLARLSKIQASLGYTVRLSPKINPQNPQTKRKPSHTET